MEGFDRALGLGQAEPVQDGWEVLSALDALARVTLAVTILFVLPFGVIAPQFRSCGPRTAAQTRLLREAEIREAIAEQDRARADTTDRAGPEARAALVGAALAGDG